jgi:Spy/CpxP family protein refolding chaperone
VEKQGALLDALMESDAPDKAQVFAQMDKLSDARASFEKSHVETLFAIYDVLTPEQAKRLRNILPRSMMLRLGFLPPVASPPPGGRRLTEP